MAHPIQSATLRAVLLTAATVWAFAGVGGCLQPLPDKSGMRDTDASGTESDGEQTSRGPQSNTTTSTSGEMPPSGGGDRPDLGGGGGVSVGASDGGGSGGDDASASSDAAEGSEGTPGWCGDYVAQDEEACDGPDHAGNTCQTLGLGGGVLSCLADCSGLDTSQCAQAGGDCCFVLSHAGCRVASIQTCVCDLDTYCCATAWDGACAQAAVDSCGAWCS